MVQDLFSRTAQRFADSVAVDTVLRSVTYGELERKAVELALILRQSGVGKDCGVGIFCANPIEGIIGIFATLKTGGIFCPLDPGFPEKRLEEMHRLVTPRWYGTGGMSPRNLARVAS